uniref:Tubulin/FtsZ GTPase domain-containing protein n=1 Tax=Ciona savignyi TaxID=51511 RepID=H2Z471_CIOSA
MTQSIVIQVGQCGNQIGCRFWDLCLREHACYSKKGIYDDAISSFFRNTDARSDEAYDLPSTVQKIKNLKARAILVDMEEGVVNELVQGYLGDIFDHKQLITDVSGSGNNWAVGHKEYGSRYQEEILDQVRKAAEACDCLQCFFILHSMGGGTGSGLGTAILSLLQDNFPEVYRFVTAVYPSTDDDVITSPYNSVLAMKELTENADCVLPINNEALLPLVLDLLKNEKPFDHMNNIVANMILNMTSLSRFEGTLNVDLNEIAMNLVPFPRLHYLVSSVAPLFITKDLGLQPRRLDQAFDDLFTKDHQLVSADPKSSLYLACALMVRGKDVNVSDLRRNIARIAPSLNFVNWNQEGWKTGLCNLPPVGLPYSLLSLANNTCVRHSFTNLHSRFMKLYSRKAHFHHYERVDNFERSCFDESLNSLTSLVKEYEE